MGVTVLEKSLASGELQWIERCKSSSMITGYKLREAHQVLGGLIGREVLLRYDESFQKFSVLVLLRAGLNLGLGIADKLEACGNSVDVHFVHEETLSKETLEAIEDTKIILADAVVNSGKSMQKILDQLPVASKKTTIIATTVIPRSSLNAFAHHNLITIRVSENKYKGAAVSIIKDGLGPDTGDRLFRTLLVYDV